LDAGEVELENGSHEMLEELARLRRLKNQEESFRIVAEARRRRRRAFIATLGAAVVVPFGIYIVFFRELDNWILPSGAAAIGVFTAMALNYLRPSSLIRTETAELRTFSQMRPYVDAQIASALERTRRSAGEGMTFTDEDKAVVLERLQAKLESEGLSSYLSSLRDAVRDQVETETLDQRFQSTQRRLSQEVQDLAKRGNLNLVLGILTTLAGVTVLGYSVFNPPADAPPAEILAYFVPRVSLVVLIEVFAYFFLKLYKQSLNEIKYFQNEVTNVEAKHLALQVAFRSEDATLQSKVVEALASTERNFVLAKDQTTVDLEREKMSNSTQANLVEMVRELFKSKT
jgi:hypothetical protein